MKSHTPEQELAAGFASVAQRYCQTIEAREGRSAADLLQEVHMILSELYFRASVLPDVEPETDYALPDSMTTDEWGALFDSLGVLLGESDLYWEVFDPNELSEEDPINGSLADDLADIYRDIKSGLMAMEPSSERISNDVIWNWRDAFTSHWGHHALDAIRAIHSHLFMHELGEEEPH